jgi:UDP-glucuronate decarboxylase
MASDVTEPVNLGDPGEITILELAELIKKLTGSSSPIVFEPLPVDDPVRRKPDISRAMERLNWKPTIALQQGLPRTIADFQSRLSGMPTRVPLA